MNLLLFNFKGSCPSTLPNQFQLLPQAFPYVVLFWAPPLFFYQMHRLLLVKCELFFCYTGYTELEKTFNLSHPIFGACTYHCNVVITKSVFY